MISITAPNRLHAQITIDAARAGKHVVCEKPLCITLEEADAMIDACRRAGVLLLYAGGAVLCPEVREGEADGGRGCVRPRASREAGREALGPALPVVLGHRAVRRRRRDGPRLPRHRLLLVVSGQARREERLLADVAAGASRPDAG